jgi:hypothetical protein
MLKTWPGQLLCSLPLHIALAAYIFKTANNKTTTAALDSNFFT